MKQDALFRATYSDWKLIRTRKCVQVVFEVPIEDADRAYQALGGMPDAGTERWFAIARLTDGAAHAPRGADSATAEARQRDPASRPNSLSQQADMNSLSRQAGICCKDPRFHKFLDEAIGAVEPNPYSIHGASAHVRRWCGVDSRAAIYPGTDAAVAWRDLHAKFLVWRDNPDLPDADCQRERVA